MYELDTNSARKADSGGSMINELGKYVGTFTQAEDVTAKSGTKGVSLTFESNAGQKARLSLYTKKSDGTTIMGFDTLMAIMTCLMLRKIKPTQGIVKSWDNDQRKEVEKHATVFPDLCGKPIGLLLETEDYLKQDGTQARRPRIIIKSVFQAETELTASEILDRKTTPVSLPRMVEGLRHRPLKTAPKPQYQTTSDHGFDNASRPSSGFDELDDSIPF